MTLEELNKIVRRCTTRGTSPFYRTLYGLKKEDDAIHINSWSDWERLPVFGKEHLTKENLPGRIFPPWSNIDTILASSGTSGNPPVYSSWVLNDGYGYRYQYHDFKSAVLSSMPTPFQQDWILRRRCGGPLIVLDPRRAQASVRLAKAAGVDSMFLILHHVPLISEEMVRAGINTHIRFIEIAGETASVSLFRNMRETFPNATIAAIYGSSDVETSPIGIPCRPMTDDDPRALYHAGEHTYLELVDDETGSLLPIQDGQEGELLITADAGDDATFPLIRYRIGDTVRIVESTCKKHGGWSFEVLGRTTMDFLKVPGGILRADEVERVLRELHIPDRFELHRYEHSTPIGLKTEVVLHVQAPSGTGLEALALTVAKLLRVSAAYTYEEGVREGFYMPLVCKSLSSESKPGKRVRMVQH
jgi:phenylacetate-coenzyme A ligase PaaK-like adenylate-forming protein